MAERTIQRKWNGESIDIPLRVPTTAQMKAESYTAGKWVQLTQGVRLYADLLRGETPAVAWAILHHFHVKCSVPAVKELMRLDGLLPEQQP